MAGNQTNPLIPVFRPWYDEAEEAAVVDVLRSRWVGLGPKTAAFERAFAEYIGVSRAVGLSSATAAIHLIGHLLDLKPGDEVIVPALTFASTALLPLYFGASPVFADVEDGTLTLDPADVERKITSKTKAIVAVHYGGTPANLVRLEDLAHQTGVTFIEDAAHACGSIYQEKRIGSRGNLAFFSFHAVKNLAIGDGGMVIPRTDDEEARLRRLRWVGIDKDTWARENRSEARYDWYYEIEEVGYKYHPNDILSAIGLVQLGKLDEGNARRRKIAARYRSELARYDWIRFLDERPNTVSAQHNFVIRIPDRESFRQFLADQRISTGVHYMPLTRHPLFRKYSVSLPVTDRAGEEVVTLPLFPDMTEQELDRVLTAVAQYSNH